MTTATRPAVSTTPAHIIRAFLDREAVHAQAVLHAAQVDFEVQRTRFLAHRIDQPAFDRATSVLSTARTELAYVNRLLNAYPRSA